MFTRSFAYHHLSAAVAVSALIAPHTVYAQAQTYALDIPTQDLGSALKALAGATGQQVVFREGTVRGKRSTGLSGRYSLDDALATMLRGTTLAVSRSGRGVIVIKPAKVSEAADEDATEIVVTGSHIRGANTVLPAKVITRKNIDNAGYATIGDVIRALPESFAGGQNPGVTSSPNIANLNTSNASSANLRGLGSDATLTLLNGHRLVSDVYYSSDISGIPLGAVSRVEVLTDGASATYGADAVAGVVNIILNKHYSGLQTSARIGGATRGGGFEQTYSILGGHSSAHSYVMLNLERSDQDSILASQRSFTSRAYPQTTLLREQSRYSAFLSAGVDLSSRLSVSVDALWSERTASQGSVSGANPIFTDIRTPAYGVTINADYKMLRDWKITTTLGTGYSSNDGITRYPTTTPPRTSVFLYKNWIRYVESAADGTLFRTPAGLVKAALGAGYRYERFLYRGNIDGSRNVKYVFGEITAPIVAPSETRVGLQELSINLAARAEDYSDFGRTTNPKAALRYKPFRDFTLRMTWGKSFKAPRLFELHQANTAFLARASQFGYVGTAPVIYYFGGNPDLKPERATSWTFGWDYQPQWLPTARFSASYYTIDFRDRVVSPLFVAARALTDPIYAPFVVRNPTTAQQASLISQAAGFSNFYGAPYDPAAVVAIINGLRTNATSQKIHGFDLSYEQDFHLSGAKITPFISASTLKIRQQTIPTLPPERRAGLVDTPPEFKGRMGATIETGNLTVFGAVNHIGEILDTGVTPNKPVPSWTTADLNISYRFDASGPLKGLRLALSMSNIFDRSPPYVASLDKYTAGLGYDSNNHSAVGRFISVNVTKDW